MKTLLKAHGLLIPSNLDPVGFKRNLCFIIFTIMLKHAELCYRLGWKFAKKVILICSYNFIH